jgi:LPXTG-motif cell wall-anchored protein
MSRYIRATVALTSAVAGAVLFAAPAFAAPADDPVSGDDRATAHPGNVVAAGCDDLYPGSHDVTGDLTTTDDGTYLDVTAVADGVEVVGVIVKGGPAYNQYDVADLGDLSWLDLHSPLNASGKPAAISHWFACGVGEATTTTPPGGTTTTTTTDSSSPATMTTTGGSSSEVSGTSVTTTTSADVAPAAQDEDLASTGFNGGWMVALAAGLLLAGGAVLVLVRKRAHS